MSGKPPLRDTDDATEPSLLAPIGGSMDIEDPAQVLEAVTGSHLETWQLGSGRFQGTLARASLGRITLDGGQYSLPVGVQGCLSRSDITIGMTLNECLWGDFNGRPLADHGCEVFGVDSELSANGPAGAYWATIVVAASAIQQTALVIGRDPHVPDRGQTLMIGGADPAVQLLRQRAREMLVVACEPSTSMSAVSAQRLAEPMGEELLLLTTLMLCRQPANEKPTFHRRARIVEDARRFMDDNRGRMVSVPELCQVTASSERALQHAFREVSGVSPTTYLRMRALHGVRRELRQSEPGRRVTEVAMSWGFWHLGRFAANYRHLFGERPSETLRVTRAGSG